MAILVGGTVATTSPEAGMGLMSEVASADFLDEHAPIFLFELSQERGDAKGWIPDGVDAGGEGRRSHAVEEILTKPFCPKRVCL